MAGPGIMLLVLLAVVAIPLAIIAIIYLLVPICKGIAWLVRHVFQFIFGVISDALRAVGAVITAVAFVPLVIGNVALGRWSAAAHFGRAIQAEGHAVLRSVYRVLIGHPARLLCLDSLTDGLEKRLPEAVAAAPGPDRPSGRVGQYDGYTIIGSLPGGGSGSKLYIAEPGAQKLAVFARSGVSDVDRVVIKSFSLREGSSLPQIVRESRALDAAKRLGLILEHELTADRFFYVMRYVPGDSLGLVTQRLHAASGSEGLADRELREVLGYESDLLRTLRHYHHGGLWHKDVKPDNIIVAHRQAHLVDFGLVTPLRSAMTLTTHGTEYFRDPEMVRMALKGVKVHEVDGARFDVYAAGAVLYAMIENSFPAHGGLSQITKRCPEALRWIVRRAMTDYDKRYESAAAMLADVEVVLSAEDPFAVKPAALPSVRGGGDFAAEPARDDQAAYAGAGSPTGFAMGGGAGAARAAVGAAVAGAAAAAERIRPRIRVTSWWSGRYNVEGGEARAAQTHGAQVRVAPAPFVARNHGVKATDQLKSARTRAAAARTRARERMRGRDHAFPSGVNGGVAAALFAFLAVCVGIAAVLLTFSSRRDTVTVAESAQVIWEDIADRTAQAAERVSSRVESRARGSSARTRASAPPAPPALPAPPVVPAATTPKALPGTLGQILVIREPLTLTGNAAQSVSTKLADLRGVGFELLGNADKPAATEKEAARQDALVADLRNTVGILPFRSPDAAERVRRWLAGQDELSMLLWVGRGEDDGPQLWLVGRDGLDRAVGSRAYEALNGPAPQQAARAPR